MRILQKERAVRNWPKLYRKGEDILLHKLSAKKYRDDQVNFLENYSRRYLVSEELYDFGRHGVVRVKRISQNRERRKLT